MKKFISLFTTLCIVFSMLGTFTVFAEETAADLEISTLAELEAFRDDVNSGNTYEGKTVVLTKDIDLSSRYGKNKNKWIPIGIGNGKFSPDAENIFKGTFDGGGHNLSNVYVHYESEYSSQTIAGFFGLNAGTIKNLVVEGEHTNLNGLCTGGIAGGNFGHIEQCVFSGYVIGPNNSGGIAGGNSGTIENCYNTATIQTYNCGGGIAGTNDGGTMTHCYNLGRVYIGRTFPDIPKEYQWLGSLCAGSADSVIGCYYLINTCKKGVYTFSEEGDGGTALTLEQFADKANFEGWDFDNIWEIDSNQLYQKPVFRLRHTPRTITEIYTAEDLKEFRYSVNCGNNYDGKTVKLMADIELDINEPWTPIGGIGHIEYQADAGGFLSTREFSGIFDGQNHTISGINLSERVGSVVGLDYDYQGFFGSVDEAEIKNFTLKGKLNAVLNTSGSSGRTYIGSAAAHLESSDISNVISYVDIETEVISSESIDVLGGIAGDVDYYSAITNCTNYGNITVTGGGSRPSFDSIGGIAGETSYSNANNCMNYGNITTNCVGSIGGVIGAPGEYSRLKYSANRGKLSVSAIAGYVGGITGRIKDNSSKLTSCYNIGKITCPDVAACGGIAGATNLDASINLQILNNNYYLDTSTENSMENDDQGNSEPKTAEQLASGEVAYLLNGSTSEGTLNWYQNIGADDYPVLDNTHAVVLYDGEKYYNYSAHEHTLVHHAAVPPTCTENGTGEYWKCEGKDACNKMFSDENGIEEIAEIPTITATGHSYGAWSITTEPTFTITGKAERICGNDNKHKDNVDLPILTDTSVWTAGARVEPTETANGSQAYTSDYGNITITIPALGHTHKICGDVNCTDNHENIEWTAWNSADALPTETGNYYLTKDVEISLPWDPTDKTALCLNGHRIRQTDKLCVIRPGGVFSLCDCAGGGTVTGGALGVAIMGEGNVFNMYGGKITENHWKGGVFDGGGVVCYDGGVFNMYGGEISSNSSDSIGGVTVWGQMSIGGKAVIKDNTDAGGITNNLFLPSDSVIMVKAPITDGAYIGIAYYPAFMRKFPKTISGANDADYSKYFHSDNETYKIINDENNVLKFVYKNNSYPYYEITDVFAVDTENNTLEVIPPNTEFTVYAPIEQIAALEGTNYGTVVFVAYDEDGALIDIATEKITNPEYFPCAYTASLRSDERTVKSLKAFIWDGVNSMIPLSNACEVSYEYTACP